MPARERESSRYTIAEDEKLRSMSMTKFSITALFLLSRRFADGRAHRRIDVR